MDIRINRQNIKSFTDLIQESKQIVLLTHKNPDGDAIGSILAFYHFLQEMHASVNMVVPNKYPSFLAWMPGISNLFIFTEREKKSLELLKKADLIVCLDFNSPSRIDHLRNHWDQIKGKKILIDHHPDPESFAHLAFSDTSMSSTAELVYHIITHVRPEQPVSKKIAECLYIGMITDTGNFSYNSSNPATFQVVSKLLEAQINKNELYSAVYDNFSFDRMRLLGLCLNSNMEYFPEYRTAIISITREELKTYNFQIGDTEGFVNYPLSIEGVVFSALFIEKSEVVKISFRSKGTFPANRFAANHFGGGGHVNAAGGESDISLVDTLEKFKSLLPKYKSLLFEK